MEKLMAVSKTLDTVIKVLQRIILIATVVAVLIMGVLTVVNAVNPDAVIGDNFNIVDAGSLSIELAPELTLDNGSVLKAGWFSLAIATMVAVTCCYAFGLARKILQPMKEGLPFDESVGKNIRKMSYVFLIYGIVGNLGGLLQTFYDSRVFERLVAMNDGVIRSVTANYQFDLSFLVVFLVLILISHIFNYGAKLQQLSDETL